MSWPSCVVVVQALREHEFSSMDQVSSGTDFNSSMDSSKYFW